MTQREHDAAKSSAGSSTSTNGPHEDHRLIRKTAAQRPQAQFCTPYDERSARGDLSNAGGPVGDHFLACSAAASVPRRVNVDTIYIKRRHIVY